MECCVEPSGDKGDEWEGSKTDGEQADEEEPLGP